MRSLKFRPQAYHVFDSEKLTIFKKHQNMYTRLNAKYNNKLFPFCCRCPTFLSSRNPFNRIFEYDFITCKAYAWLNLNVMLFFASTMVRFI